ncbi:PLP-dependent aminotransferase family protein [Ktedonobacter racemifer]|uniref:Putative transcriptional regulator, GntR family n=1 Tax=Ktedonobacter racemifer DSM 44963 TaxID=485913 RepID=D6U7P5_KTERA|nr:PLP-dependent aminotransferase family protein [Ktedonobacter racemifer]EFH79906.1 putative transcriptional regulator, GntR family [Ktedonobacter racemifer DSM 44963]
MPDFWDLHYAQRVQLMKSSAIRDLLKLTEQPEVISFAGGLPAAEIFPVEKVASATQKVLQERGVQALQYGPSEGYRPLLELIAQTSSRDGLTITPENIFIVSGSQQGLDFVGRLLVNPGDLVLVESPTYMGALQAMAPYGADYITVPSDENGLRTDALEEMLALKPKLMYVLPNFQNPSGVTLSLERRKRLVELANRYGVPVVEDDPYSQLRFEGEPLPSLLTLDSQLRKSEGEPYRGNIIQLNTFSKVLTPGLRVAWIVASPELVRKLVQTKQGADLHTASLNQLIVHELLREGFIEQHIPLIRRTYGERRNIMLQAMEEHFPAGIRWTRPQGGMFLWVVLPEGLNSTELLREAVKENVAFVPGTPFHAQGGGENTLRLSFSNATPEQIREGIARLGRVFHKALAETAVKA